MPITIEDQFKFLISCIRWSDHGKVNFDAVASECKIVTKAAAAKRYERLMKTHGISVNGASPKQPRARPIKNEYRNRRAATIAKKMKLKDNTAFDDGTYEDDEVMNSELSNGGVKEEFVAREEAYDDGPSVEESTNQTQYNNGYNGYSQMGGEMNENYGGSMSGGNSSGYATPMGYALGSHDQQHGGYFYPGE